MNIHLSTDRGWHASAARLTIGPIRFYVERRPFREFTITIGDFFRMTLDVSDPAAEADFWPQPDKRLQVVPATPVETFVFDSSDDDRMDTREFWDWYTDYAAQPAINLADPLDATRCGTCGDFLTVEDYGQICRQCVLERRMIDCE